MNRRKQRSAQYCSVYSTPMGPGGVVASAAGLVEVFLPFAGSGVEEMLTGMKKLYPQADTGNGLTEKSAQLLQRYFSGERVEFRLELDKEGFTPFQKRVYEYVAAIPYGQVKTYARIAAEIGCRGAARGVGTAMARNPLPIVIPCHRVVGASGAMTGTQLLGALPQRRFC